MGKLSVKQAMAIAFKKAAKACPDKAKQIYKPKGTTTPPPSKLRKPKAKVYHNHDYLPGSGVLFHGTMKQMRRTAKAMREADARH
jgi:hypothetical protein